MERPALVNGIAQAIARQEGFFTTGSVAARHYNPGNLRSWGTTPVEGGFARFGNLAAGWAALRAQVSKNIDRGLTLFEFFNGQRDAHGVVKQGGYPGYAPSIDHNDPDAYARVVGRAVGIDPSKPIREAIDV